MIFGLAELLIIHQIEVILEIMALNVQGITVALDGIVLDLDLGALVPHILAWRNNKR